MKCLWQWVMVGGYAGILGFSSNVSALPFRLQPPPQSYYYGYYGGSMCVDGSCCTAPACPGFAPLVATCPRAPVTNYASSGMAVPSAGLAGMPLNTANGQTLLSPTANPPVRQPLAPNGSSQTSSAIPSDPRMDVLLERLNRIEDLLILHEKYLQDQREHRLK